MPGWQQQALLRRWGGWAWRTAVRQKKRTRKKQSLSKCDKVGASLKKCMSSFRKIKTEKKLSLPEPTSLSINYAWGLKANWKAFCSFHWLFSTWQYKKKRKKKTDRKNYQHMYTNKSNNIKYLSSFPADSQRGADTCFHEWLHSSPGNPEGRASLPSPGWCKHQWKVTGWLLRFPWTL